MSAAFSSQQLQQLRREGRKREEERGRHPDARMQVNEGQNGHNEGSTSESHGGSQSSKGNGGSNSNAAPPPPPAAAATGTQRSRTACVNCECGAFPYFCIRGGEREQGEEEEQGRHSDSDVFLPPDCHPR